MVDDKLFHFLVSRLQNRESVSLALSTITSSASLILLSLALYRPESISLPLIFMGILFPLVALIYIEITYQGLHRHDHKWIKELIYEDKKWDSRSREKDEIKHDILEFTKNRVLRIVLIRFLFLLPILGWLFILDWKLDLGYYMGIYLTEITIGLLIIRYNFDEIKDLHDDP